MMNEGQKRLTATGLVIGVFLAAMEGSIVATAMPTVIMDLGGEHLYALPFSMYLLTMTVTSPVWGKLSDIYGRRLIYTIGVLLFLGGSAGCGMSQSMGTLIGMRVVQGLGAGCITPLTFVINAEMFEVKRRAKVQGYMSAVWGFSGLVGPLLGGFIVDWFNWRYVFYLNIPFGIVALFLVIMHYRDSAKESEFRLDWLGALLFTGAASLLVYGLESWRPWLVGVGLGGLALSWTIESRHGAPLLPVQSLKLKIPRLALSLNFLGGMAYFGILAFLPLYVQRVEEKGATTAGLVLTPMIVGWTMTNIIGGRLLGRLSLFTLNRIGFSVLVASFLGFVWFYDAPITYLAVCGLGSGLGMGFSMLSTLLIVQEYSPRRELGSSTSSVVFARMIGGSVGVSILSGIVSETLTAPVPEMQAAFRWAYLTCALFSLVALAVSVRLSQIGKSESVAA